MKTIIAGSRGITEIEEVRKAIEESGFEITEVVSGTARGVDTLGEQWAKENGIPIVRFPPDWNKDGKAAGGIRNSDMAVYGEALVAVMKKPKTNGTRDMIAKARLRKLKYHVRMVD